MANFEKLLIVFQWNKNRKERERENKMCVVKQKESNYTTRGERSSSDRVETAASALCFSSNHQQQQPRGEERNEESTATAAADVQRENEPGSTQPSNRTRQQRQYR